ncbi:MAG: SapC family protein, partial [Campylobacterota bacterium]|nr:SapC family protein [Campylobacterota bacterium]
LSKRFPIIITGGEEQHFTALLAVGENDNYFSLHNRYEDRRYIPIYLRSYPFLVVEAKDENDDTKLYRSVAIDVESPYIGVDKSIKLFEDNKETQTLNGAIKLVQTFDNDRFEADKLIEVLKEYKLLDKRDITLKLDENEPQTILSDFYVVNQTRLYELSDDILLEWIKKGWIYLLENHMRSIENIDLLLAQSIVKH